MVQLEQGTVLGERFRLIGELGQGATASVWLADDVVLHARVALKIMHPHLASDAAAQRRLRREVAEAARVVDPYVLAPRALHHLDGVWLVEMPFHDGLTLRLHLHERGPLNREALSVFARTLSQAVMAIHRAGVVHRDISPDNILVAADGSASLTDFGLVRRAQDGTLFDVGVGTLGFMAPEAMDHGEAAPSADLYAMGAAIYFAATGRAPFDGRTPVAVVRQQLLGKPPSLSDTGRGVPRDLATLVDALLSGAPEDRPASARVVHDVLSGRLPLKDVVAQAPPPPAPEPPAAEKPPVTASGAIAPIHPERTYLPHGTFQVRLFDRRFRHKDRLLVQMSKAMASSVRGVMELPAPVSREELLAAEVGRYGGMPRGTTGVPHTLLSREFILVKGVDRKTGTHLAHLARTEGQIAAFLQRRLRQQLSSGELRDLPTAAPSILQNFDRAAVLDRTRRIEAPDFAAPDPSMTAADARTQLDRARQRLQQVLLAADGKDVTAIRQPHHVFGDLTFYQWVAFAGFHEQRHVDQAREVAEALRG